jgi:NTP pyrophosphatase (non-canonical NTP hydrolase)
MNLNEHLNDIVLPRTNHMTDKHRATMNAALGLAGETGEIVDLIKKFEFHGHPFELSKLQNEIGDVLFYLQWLANTHGFNLETCLEANGTKLKARYPISFSSEQSINRKV